MKLTITRRKVLAGCVAFLSTVKGTRGQTLRVPRVAIVTSGPGDRIRDWIKDTLKTLGYEEGKNLVIDFREANGRYAELPRLLAEVIAFNPDVIVAEATPAIAAAQKLTTTIPIIMAPSTDPVGLGFVQSFARPGGNITGIANMFDDLTAKMLDVVKLVFPQARKLGILSSANPSHPPRVATAIRAAGAVGIVAESFVAPNPEDLEGAFANMKAARCDVVYVLADPPRAALPPLAIKYNLPAVYQVSTYPGMGALMAYGPDIHDVFIRAAHYVDRILKGGRPAEMPVEQPTKFVMVINLRTARTMNLSIPERVLLMADEVIE
ncbi:ABC transporter substrate-binding protein [Bradyrhizobium liaoningense]|uniref:ABC transporter substrate-binding protein n=1 Tax=Bradyrhizobium liaoningense TaxID=43992 RepID=UPI001BAD0EC2|nr:ABC transporter substrate-binding protein [Bradyrhizobium liaoningense]MBR0717291.1 ABC transporter substrate-binding protein [Bradyrhizobium liaoningense]